MTKFFSKTLSFIKSVRGLSILIGLTVVSTGAVLAFKDDLDIFKSKEDSQSKTGIEENLVENIEPSAPLVEVSPTQIVTPTIIPKATLQPTNASTIPSGIVLVSIIDAGMQYCRADMVDTVNNVQQQKTDIFNKTVDCRMDVSNAVKPGEISPCYTQEEHDTIQKAIKILQDNCIDKRGVDAYGTHVLERLK